MAARGCQFVKADGEPCRAPPLRDGEFCRMHSPEHADEVAEARRLGGLRRRREKTIEGAYDYEGITSVDKIQRVLEIAVLDTLGLENSVSRSRTLAYLCQVAIKAFEVGELVERLEQVEAAVQVPFEDNDPVFGLNFG